MNVIQFLTGPTIMTVRFVYTFSNWFHDNYAHFQQQFTDKGSICRSAINRCGTSHWNTQLPFLMSWERPDQEILPRSSTYTSERSTLWCCGSWVESVGYLTHQVLNPGPVEYESITLSAHPQLLFARHWAQVCIQYTDNMLTCHFADTPAQEDVHLYVIDTWVGFHNMKKNYDVRYESIVNVSKRVTNCPILLLIYWLINPL